MNQKLMIALISLPLFAALLGMIVSAGVVYLLFHPDTFRGVRVRGVELVRPRLPRRLRQAPVVSKDGRLGWQGLVPARAERVAVAAVDQGLIDLPGLATIARDIAPDQAIVRVAQLARAELAATVEELARTEHAVRWRELPPTTRRAVHERVRRELPSIVVEVAGGLAGGGADLVSGRELIVGRLSRRPELLGRILLLGRAGEIAAITTFGCFLGIPFGFALFGLLQLVIAGWSTVLGFVLVGLLEAVVTLVMLCHPIVPHRWVPWRQGLLARRRAECGDELVAVLAGDVVTVDAIGEELVAGEHGAMIRSRLRDALRPAVAQAVRSERAAARVAVGTREFEQLRHGPGPAPVPQLHSAEPDPDLAARCYERVRLVSGAAVAALRPAAFADLLRAATRREWWVLVSSGAVAGLIAGLVHVTVLGPVR